MISVGTTETGRRSGKRSAPASPSTKYTRVLRRRAAHEHAGPRAPAAAHAGQALQGPQRIAAGAGDALELGAVEGEARGAVGALIALDLHVLHVGGRWIRPRTRAAAEEHGDGDEVSS